MVNGEERITKGRPTKDSARTLEPGARATRDIQPRTYAFACRIVKLVRAMPREQASQVLARQLLRSGTSIGANVEEAQGAQSHRDFVRRMNIARTEARETLYWLRLITDTGLLPPRRMSAIVQDADELVRILVSIVKAARRGEPHA